MNTKQRLIRIAMIACAFGAGLLGAPVASQAQTSQQATTIVGSLVNFDAVNDTGVETQGFEIQLEGLQPQDITRVFGQSSAGCWIRYCGGTITPYGTAPVAPFGVFVRWTANYNASTHQFTTPLGAPGGGSTGTPPVSAVMPPGVISGEYCWSLAANANYPSAGCEHFGISTAPGRFPTQTTYRWLIGNPATGTIVAAPPTVVPPVAIPQPVAVVALVGVVQQVQAVIPAPPPVPAPVPHRYGKAEWVKVYKTELDRHADLDELVGGHPNDVVPNAQNAVAETEWKLLQFDVSNPDNGSSQLRNGGSPNGGSHSVVRRYEFYKYTGPVVAPGGTSGPKNARLSTDNLETSLCPRDANQECTQPANGDLGGFIGAQMAAQNLGGLALIDQTITGFTLPAAPTFNNPPFTVSATGGGSGNPVLFAASGACMNTNPLNNAEVTIVGIGTCTVTASQNGNASFAPAPPITEIVNVAKASATVAFDAGTLSQTYNGTIKTVSTTTSPVGLPLHVVFTGTPQNAGSYPVTATINDPNYTGSATGTLTINQASATVVWSNPADIVYGTPLSPVQLNATASIAGTFTYTPAAGTILGAGTQTLQAAFTPTDAANFEAATTTVTIVVAKANQAIAWTNPADIVYGTALSPAQLNAVVTVVGPAASGAVIYTPASGTVLQAGNGQTLTVTAQATQNYEQASATVTINVHRAPLSLRVDDQTKLYGNPLPTLTGTLTGVVNGDAIAPSYSTTATTASAVGRYPITGQLSDGNGRLPNYDVTIAPATLAVTKTPLMVKADDASKQYSDALPTFTASFRGLVLGETPAVLGGALTMQTTATSASGPGNYPIVAAGLTSSNYDISFAGGMLTVTPEDAAVVFIAPLTAATSPASGNATITLAATVQELAGQDEGANTLGDIRNATLTFVDRATGQTLCTAPIGLVSSSQPSIGVAICSFSAPAGTYTIESRVGGWYARDAQADDVVVTVVKPNEDSVKGDGRATMTTAAGADPNSRLDFHFEAEYDKSALNGELTLTFHRTENGTLRTYQIDTTSMVSLVIQPTTAGGIAWITGTATLTDVTSKHSPIVVDDHATFLATFTDNGEAKTDDTIAVTLIGKNGGLLFSSKWSSTHTDDEAVFDGNIKVHLDK